jgi:hypothetical protein
MKMTISEAYAKGFYSGYKFGAGFKFLKPKREKRSLIMVDFADKKKKLSGKYDGLLLKLYAIFVGGTLIYFFGRMFFS